MKDQHTRMLHGRLLRPLKVGSSALIDHEGQFILTVAYRAMQQSIVSWKRGESRRRQAEEAYCALYGRRETVCDAELSEAYFFSELQKCGTPQQAAFALLRMQGYSIVEIAARYKLDPRRVRRMLKGLYSAYLRFRGNGKEAKQ